MSEKSVLVGDRASESFELSEELSGSQNLCGSVDDALVGHALIACAFVSRPKKKRKER